MNDTNCSNETCFSNNLLSDLSEDDERIFKSNRSISLNKSKIDFRKNWLEMIDEDSLNEKRL
jgi:hypothetical protein